MTNNSEKGSNGDLKLSLLLKRFPQNDEKIRQLYAKNDSFRHLCEDYRDCVKALKHWSESTSDEAPVRHEEYTVLLKELEAEVLHYLGK